MPVLYRPMIGRLEQHAVVENGDGALAEAGAVFLRSRHAAARPGGPSQLDLDAVIRRIGEFLVVNPVRIVNVDDAALMRLVGVGHLGSVDAKYVEHRGA